MGRFFLLKKKHRGLGSVSTSVALQFAKDVQDVLQIGKALSWLVNQPPPNVSREN